MPHYIVTWKHGIDSASPAEAARDALALLMIAKDRSIFDVYGESPDIGRWRVQGGVSVDLENRKPPVAEVHEIPVAHRTWM